MAQAVAEHADKTLQTVDAILVSVVQEAEAPVGEGRATVPLQRLLTAQIAALPWIARLVIFDAAGTPSAGTLGIDAKELKAFAFHQGNTDRRVHVDYLRSTTEPRSLILVSRRINAPDGSFAGAAVAAIDMAYLQSFYSTFDVGTDGTISLLLDTGTLLVRRPANDEGWIGKDVRDWTLFQSRLPLAAAGTFDQTSHLDDLARLLSYSHLAHYPLVTIAGVGKAEALAGWRTDARWHLAGIGILTMIAGLLGWRLAIQAKHRVTAQHQTAEAIADYRLLADNSMDMVVRMTVDGTRMYVSPGSRHVLGYEPEELLHKQIKAIFHPDDVAHYEDFKRQLVAGSRTSVHTHRLRHKNGSYVWVEATARSVPGTSPDEPVTIISAVRDISSRMMAEARLMDAIESIDDGFAMWDDEWRFIMCNSRYREFYRMSADYLVVGTPMYELLLGGAKAGQYGPTDDPEELARQIMRVNADPNATYERLLGDGRWILGCNRRTALGGWAGVRTDITVQKQRELELHQTKALLERQAADLSRLAGDLTEAKRAAEQASLVKSEFLANMSHEIRTPMNGIIGMNGLLLRTPLTADQHKYADNVRLSAEALLGIINDILDVSKLEAGKVGLEAIDFDLAELVEGAVELLAARGREKGLEISVIIEEVARRPLRGDPTRLRQILLNLLSNAIKFTEEGSVTVEVKAARLEVGWTELRIEVADTGIGLFAETKAKLFEKFEQADGSITRRFGGTGLGLHITRQLVELMGGRIGVLDRPTGKGTLFWIELSLPEAAPSVSIVTYQGGTPSTMRTSGSSPSESPSLEAATVDSQTDMPDQPLDSPPEPGGSSGHILLVEDNRINRALASALLEEARHTVSYAEDGLLALTAIEQDTYDLVLMDVQMPNLDGLEATRRIRGMGGRHAAVPIIAMTANAMEGDRQRCIDAGMNDYISKPIDVKLFIATVTKWLGDNRTAAVEDEPPAAIPLAEIIDETQLDRLAAVMAADRFGGLVGSYLDGARTLLERLKSSLAKGNLVELAHGSHDLKGTSGNFGARRLQGLAEQLEAASRAGDMVASRRLMSAIEQASNDTSIALRSRIAPQRAARKAAAS